MVQLPITSLLFGMMLSLCSLMVLGLLGPMMLVIFTAIIVVAML